jgi:dTMP kinase
MTRVKRGTYIIRSGGEGTGKTSILNQLKVLHPEMVFVREPGHTTFAERIRAVLLEQQDLDLDPLVEAQLFMAVRLDLLQRVVRPALKEGKVVISDRGFPETFALQWWAGRGKKDFDAFRAWIRDLELPLPDLWILLDLDPKIGLARRSAHGQVNRIDQKPLEYHQRVREGFLEIFNKNPFPSKKIDANRPLPELIKIVDRTVTEVITSSNRE